MATLKLKKPATAAPRDPARRPVRGTAPRGPRPTLAQAAEQAAAERAQREQKTQRREPARAAAPGRTAPQTSPPSARPGPRTPPPTGTRAQPPQPSTPPPRAAEALHPPGSLRLSKLMAERGLASRREADEWIEQGFVRVDGVVVDTLGARVLPSQRIEIDPRAAQAQARLVTVLLHKPLGIVSGQAEDGHTPAVALVKAENRWSGDASPLRFNASQLKHLVAAGRLDIDSTGLLVLTQDGRVAKALIGEHSKVEKEYLVRVDWPAQPDITDLKAAFPAEGLARMRHGLVLDGRVLEPAKVSWQSEQQLRVVLREGMKRQIRRMCEEVGLRVLALKRIRMGRVNLGELPPGQWRYLGEWERFQ